MSITIPVNPLMPPAAPYSLDIRTAISTFKGKPKEWGTLASVLDQIQSSSNRIESALRKISSNTFNEIIIRDASGQLIGWIGSRPPYVGAWFKTLYVGADGPDTAPFFADVDGDVIIGKNGSLSIQDGGENEVGWLGVQADAAKTVTNATNTTPIVVSVAAHGYEDGDTVFITGVTGNTNANGYRIVKNSTAGNFEITDLAGVNIAGNGAFGGTATSTRYFGGGRFQTLAIGESFTDYKLRAYADGQLKIRDALITLTDVANNGYIEINPDGPYALFQNTATGEQTLIEDGFINLSNFITPAESVSLGYSGINMVNATLDIIVSITDAAGAGQINVSDASGSGTIGLAGATGTVDCFILEASTSVDTAEYFVSGTPGIDSTLVIPTGFAVNTASAVISVDFGASTTVSDTFVQSITYTDVTITNSKGLLTGAV